MGASGSTTINFGAFPGSSETFVDVASVGVISTSLIEAWVLPVLTADHSVDEHMIESIRVIGRFLSNGNIRIHAYAIPFPQLAPINRNEGISQLGVGKPNMTSIFLQAHRLHGRFTVGWVWL